MVNIIHKVLKLEENKIFILVIKKNYLDNAMKIRD